MSDNIPKELFDKIQRTVPMTYVDTMIFNEKGEFLLLDRGNMWQLPGGRLEFGEYLEVGANREVIEETGIQANNYQHKGFVESVKGNHKIIHVFLAKTRYTDVILSKEHIGYRWVSKNDNFKGLREIVQKEIEIVLNGNS